jgi:hypothetical protein
MYGKQLPRLLTTTPFVWRHPFSESYGVILLSTFELSSAPKYSTKMETNASIYFPAYTLFV